jgi:DNA-binding transcriptional ArsR family regulator
MVKRSGVVLDAVFAALADPTRRAIVSRLARGAASVGDLAAPFAVSLPAISKHLGVLERAGMVVREKSGRVRHCHLVPAPMLEAGDWIARYWEAHLDAVEAHLARGQRATGNRQRRSNDAGSVRRQRVPVRPQGPRRPGGEGNRVRARGRHTD